MVPLGVAHVGCWLTEAVGVAGAEGAALITTLPEATEVQPPASLTVKV